MRFGLGVPFREWEVYVVLEKELHVIPSREVYIIRRNWDIQCQLLFYTPFPAHILKRQIEDDMEGYEILHQLGSGSYATVFMAYDKAKNTNVAMKICKGAEKYSAGEEVTCSFAMPEHENIARVRDSFEFLENNVSCHALVFDLMEQNLLQHMRNVFFVPAKNVWYIMDQILEALHHCHENHVVHRDIKPENILLDSDMNIKVTDFGLGWVLEDDDEMDPSVGTLYYKAPEMLLLTDDYNTKVDIWAAGCVFAELIAGRELFPGENEFDILERIFAELGTPNERTWPGVSRLLEGMEIHPNNLAIPFGSEHTRLGTDASDLLKRMLTLDPRQRIDATEALQHTYFDNIPE